MHEGIVLSQIQSNTLNSDTLREGNVDMSELKKKNNNGSSNDKIIGQEWQQNQFDLKNLTVGNIPPSQFNTNGNVHPDTHETIEGE